MKEIILNREEIKEIAKKIAAQLEVRFKDSNSVPVFACMLKGAQPFFNDVVMNYHGPVELDYIQTRSYSGTESTGVIHLVKDFSSKINGRDVVIIEDVVDTGLTLEYLKNYMNQNYNPHSISVACIVNKTNLRKRNVPGPDYWGMELKENKFLLGYGLDYNEIGRNIEMIYVPDQDELDAIDKEVKNL